MSQKKNSDNTNSIILNQKLSDNKNFGNILNQKQSGNKNIENILNKKGSDSKQPGNLAFNIVSNNPKEKPVDELIEQTPRYHKKRKAVIISISIIIFLSIVAVVLIVGHFKYGWFMKKNDLIIEQNRKENLVLGYSEKKAARSYYDLDGLDSDEDNIINNYEVSTDFIVGINKRKKINSFFEFKENDYLYESFLLIINLTLTNETNSENLGGLNILDESKSAEDLIKLNDEFFLKIINKEKNNNITNKNKTSFNENIPICRFYYFRNGTIDKIYFPKGMNEFYKSAMTDLIEKITPKLSKSLYKNKDEKRRLQDDQNDEIKLNYEKIVKNGTLEKVIIYEDKEQKEFNEKNKELKSKIVRTFNSTGDITSLEMKGEAIFKSPTPTKKDDLKNPKKNNLRFVEEIEDIKDIYIDTNETYDNYGFNEFSMNVTSNMELIYNEIEPNILKKLNIISRHISFEKYNNSNEIITFNKREENTFNNNSENYPLKTNDTIKRNLDEKNIINYPGTFNVYSTLFNGYFLSRRVIIKQKLYINPYTNLRRDSIILTFGYMESTLHEIDIYHNPNYSSDYNYKYISPNTDDFTSWMNVFGFSIGVNLYLAFHVSHGINYSVKSQQMYTRGYANYDVSVGATFGPNFFFVSFGAGIRGSFLGGNAYIEANSISGSSLARFRIYKDFIPRSVDIYFYFTINIIFWKKTYEQTFNIFKIGCVFEDRYYYY